MKIILKKIITVGFILLGISLYSEEKPTIQLAILLDTSNSMDGLISQAKGNLWTIINQFSKASKDGKESQLEIAIYEYGNSRLSPQKGYIRQVNSFSSDLDQISENLFRLSTSGGDEFCGMVIQEALNNLDWNNKKNFKAIYIAGNERFTQGPVHYHSVCSWAKEKGIIINTIHCGDKEIGIQGEWEKAAKIANGEFMNINQNREIDNIETPYDEKLYKLNQSLNKTYIPYGSQGSLLFENQSRQDKNAISINKKVATDRIISKSSKKYENSSWDLLDGIMQNKIDPNEIPEKELPQEMQIMTKSERKKYIARKQSEREIIQTKIQKLAEKRKKYISKNKKNHKELSLDEAIIQSATKQGTAAGFSFE